jgi:hypothetical protein
LAARPLLGEHFREPLDLCAIQCGEVATPSPGTQVAALDVVANAAGGDAEDLSGLCPSDPPCGAEF